MREGRIDANFNEDRRCSAGSPLLDWIPRRADCGTPCQTCRHRCDYQAITPAGAVSYDECFQCMDCVVIYSSDEKCAPLIMEAKRARTIRIARSVNL